MSVDQDVKDAFENLAAEVDPSPGAWSRTTDRIARFQRRRILVSLVAVAVVAAGIAVAIPQVKRSAGVVEPGPSGEWRTYRDPDYGWTIQYPPTWHIQHVADHKFEHDADGALLSNIDHEFRHPHITNGWTSMWDMREQPDNLIVIQFAHIVAIHSGHCSSDDTPLPLSLQNAKRSTPAPDSSYGAPRDERYMFVTARGDDHYILNAWIGPGASSEEVATAERIVASLDFSQAKPGAHGTPGFNCPATDK